MRSGEWYLKFEIRITGETSVGDSVDMSHEVGIPLFAKDILDAERKAETVIADVVRAIDTEDREFFRVYCNAIEDEDGVSVSDFHLCCEKAIDVSELSIIAGP